MADTNTRFPVRLPSDLHQSLKAIAEKNRRSLHSEILIALEKHAETNAHLIAAGQGER